MAAGGRVGQPARSSTTTTTSAAPLAVLGAMADAKVPAFIFSSTAATFGEPRARADRRGPPAAADQHLRRDQAGDRAGAAALRARLRHPLGGAALLQRRRRRSGRDHRRGSPARDPPDPARHRRDPRRRAALDLRRRLPDARRHLPARLRPRRRPRRRAPAGAGAPAGRRRRRAPTTSASAGPFSVREVLQAVEARGRHAGAAHDGPAAARRSGGALRVRRSHPARPRLDAGLPRPPDASSTRPGSGGAAILAATPAARPPGRGRERVPASPRVHAALSGPARGGARRDGRLRRGHGLHRQADQATSSTTSSSARTASSRSRRSWSPSTWSRASAPICRPTG